MSNLTWSRERDGYGRTVYYLLDRDQSYKSLGVVVRVPRTKPASFFVNDYTRPQGESVTRDFRTLAQAQAFLVQTVGRAVA